MQHLQDTFSLAVEPLRLAARLVSACDEFLHLSHARIPILFSQRTLSLHGAPCAAFIGIPKVQGPFRVLFEWCVAGLVAPVLDGEDPDFLILVDIAIWESLDAERRERLVYHELKHVVVREDEYGVPRLNKETGDPMLKLVPHDIEAFDDEIRRYGPDIVGIETTCEAIVQGFDAAQRRNRKRVA